MGRLECSCDKIIDEVGLPPGAFNLVTGRRHRSGRRQGDGQARGRRHGVVPRDRLVEVEEGEDRKLRGAQARWRRAAPEAAGAISGTGTVRLFTTRLEPNAVQACPDNQRWPASWTSTTWSSRSALQTRRSSRVCGRTRGVLPPRCSPWTGNGPAHRPLRHPDHASARPAQTWRPQADAVVERPPGAMPSPDGGLRPGSACRWTVAHLACWPNGRTHAARRATGPDGLRPCGRRRGQCRGAPRLPGARPSASPTPSGSSAWPVSPSTA